MTREEAMSIPLVEMRGIRKSFGPVRALWDVDLTLMPGDPTLNFLSPTFTLNATNLNNSHDALTHSSSDSLGTVSASRRGLRRLTISVSAEELSVIADQGYEGAASTDQDCRSQAISRFISDTVACLDRTR